MKKVLIIICCIIATIVAQLIWQDQSRDYYCFSDGKCFTIWKRTSKCYIIPGKYHGIFAPKDNYIQTLNRSFIDVINNKTIQQGFIVFGDSDCKLQTTKHIIFYNLQDPKEERVVDSIYAHKEGNYHVYNADVEHYSIDIQEMYTRTNVKGQTVPTVSTYTIMFTIAIFYASIILLIVFIIVFIFKLIGKLHKKG